MKKGASVVLVIFFLTVFLLPGGRKALADNSGQISCGDYELVTRKRVVGGVEEEALYRINNKTGYTWVFEGQDTGWVKLREQK